MSSGINPKDLRNFIIRPTITMLGLDGAGVEELLLGTAMQESGCGTRLAQQGGPALGLWQMEPQTHDDLWINFLPRRLDLADRIARLLFTGFPKPSQLIGNLYYACAMARLQYFRSPRPIPSPGDLQGQAEIYKVVYNTPSGAATVEQYMANAKGVINV